MATRKQLDQSIARVKTQGEQIRKALNVVTVEELMAWEDGSQSETETVDMFQRLINSGRAWTLQGMYGRFAARLIEAGYCQPA